MNSMAIGTDRRARLGLVCVVALVALAGCQQNGEAIQPVSAAPPTKPEMNLSAPSGVPVAAGQPVDIRALGQNRTLVARRDPWALTGEEAGFDSSQKVENILSSGNYRVDVDIQAQEIEPAGPRVEPVPAWRLSGVIVGNGVMALLDTGRQTYEIRPGFRVPGTPWTVVSIDSEKAILRREDNVVPSEFAVGLAGPIGDVPVEGRGGNAAGGGAGGGNRDTGRTGQRGGGVGGGFGID